MKRTITLRVEVKDDEEYADVIAALTSHPSVIASYMTRVMKPVKERLSRMHGIGVSGPSMSGAEWIKQNT